MTRSPSRRQVLAQGMKAGAAALAAPSLLGAVAREARLATDDGDPLFTVSLAEWSLHRALFANEMSNLDFPAWAKREAGIDAVEYVNTFFKDKATDFRYLRELELRCADEGVRSVLIMIDGEGELADVDDAARARAVENHLRWIAAASFLGCHAIRVNAGGGGTWDERRDRAADSLHHLATYAAPYGLSVIVENHGGLSSNGKWLAEVMRKADHPGVGTLPDFGNFSLGDGQEYDRYLGVTELMPFAKAVSAKSHDFDARGEETHTDYHRMLRIVVDAGYTGRLGVEYEGDGLSEKDGVLATKALVLRVRDEIAAERAAR
ncbi:MAG: sugar phosphate isomerase/epimerase [Planctomycetes bacterium]|nr:sugar phosphate isomerase/epimerase [Planctomycetota bacterium]